MKRKLLSLLLVTAMATTLLIGCGGNDAGANANQDTNEESQSEEEGKGNSYGVTSANNPYGYTIPTELGSSLESMTFQLEGDYYSFPMPLSALFENGWELEGGYDKETMLLESGDFKEIDLVNSDGKKLDTVRVINETENSLALEECLVSIIWIERDFGAFDLNLPEGVTMKSDMDLLEQLTDAKTDGNNITYYWYSDEEHTHSLSIDYEQEMKGVSRNVGIVRAKFTYWN